ncbi:DNA repair and recombination protein RadB [Candidatus Woesearchaeota archaeon]|nr:DNA repair and recombination protein RadB [Candidatus Woesearchaeota archaeon]
METKFPTGTAVFDWLLEGGYEHDCITTLYGPAGSGKTNICLIAAAATPEGKKTVYIDTEGSFSISRLKQLRDDWRNVLERVIILQPTTFEEQKKVFEKLKELVNDKIAMIILDSSAMLYRLEMGKSKDVHAVNRALGTQLAYLTQIARKQNVPVIITNQVYADFEDKDKVKMVGGDLLRYASKCLIELQKSGKNRLAVLRKHRSIEEDKEVLFRIVDKGVEEVGS